MCGFAGLVGWCRPLAREAEEDVARMAATLEHRGPDDAGVWSDQAAGVALGFRRLAILDLSPTGHQPMRSRDGRFTVVFNGEIYNHRDLREELEARRRSFRGTSDTEVILEAASEWGSEAAVTRLWGMFALALWDAVERRLLLARDRLGKKPLYMAETSAGLLFASELKAIRAHPAFDPTLDPEAIASYIRFGYVPAPQCVYRHARKLRPGWIATVDADGTIRERAYWNLGEVAARGIAAAVPLDADDAADELDRRLGDAVARRMLADVPLGALLSGGIDSSTVVALMQAQSSRPVRTFTVGFAERAFDEADAARAVAAYLGTDHIELRVTPEEARAVVPKLPDIYDEPFGDASQIPTFLIAAVARRYVTVCLSGDGGDEVFGGYVRHVWADRFWRRLSPWPLAARQLGGALLAAIPPGMADATYRAAEPLLPGSWRQRHPADKLRKLAALACAQSLDDVYLSLVSAWPAPERLLPGTRGLLPSEWAPWPAGLSLDGVDRVMFLDQATYLPDDILVKVDRASMAASLEVRAPLLDHRILEWAWHLPRALRADQGVGKRLLRRVLARYVPPALTERPKTGFGIPVGEWLRGPLRDWAESLLDPRRLAADGLIDPAPVRQVWQEHLRGRQDHAARLWTVLMLQAWRERWARVTSGPGRDLPGDRVATMAPAVGPGRQR
ncbi:MAG: asparagine synthase (glutamine-hydrolyzing) [Armatimonadota bacterium]|nr:asparagine synthase (glutamine-hydrolyzing) [Armatimonadota bacterium]